MQVTFRSMNLHEVPTKAIGVVVVELVRLISIDVEAAGFIDLIIMVVVETAAITVEDVVVVVRVGVVSGMISVDDVAIGTPTVSMTEDVMVLVEAQVVGVLSGADVGTVSRDQQNVRHVLLVRDPAPVRNILEVGRGPIHEVPGHQPPPSHLSALVTEAVSSHEHA